MSAEKEFGFIITQGISRNMTKAKLAEKFCNFLAEQKRELSKALRMSADRIHTNCYYDCDSREYKGLLRIQGKCADDRIEHEAHTVLHELHLLVLDAGTFG